LRWKIWDNNSKAVHRAYSRKALVELPSLANMNVSGSCFPMAEVLNLLHKA